MFEIREYIEGKEIGIKFETVLFFDWGKNIVNREQWKTCAHRKERNIGIEYETVVALATLEVINIYLIARIRLRNECTSMEKK